MESLLVNWQEHLSNLCALIGAISILATVVVRLTPSKSDDEIVYGAAAKFWKFVSYLPTIGINPRTQKLEEAYKELKGEQGEH